MKLTFDEYKGEMKFSIWELLDEMTADQKRELAGKIIWEEPILTDFVERLMGDTGYSNHIPDLTAIRMKFLAMMPVAAVEIIRSLQHRVDQAEASEKRWQDHAWALDRRWPDGCHVDDHATEATRPYRRFGRPQHPEFVYAKWKEREALAAQNGIELAVEQGKEPNGH